MFYKFSLFKNTGEFTKRVRETSFQLFVPLYTLPNYPFAHKQLRRHLPNPFREFPCIIMLQFPKDILQGKFIRVLYSLKLNL